MSIFAHMRARATSSASAPVSKGPCQAMVSRIGLFQLARPCSVMYSASNTNHIVRSRRRSSEPVLDAQPRHAAEFADVVGRQWNIERNRVRGDQHVERTNECATPMKRCSNLAVGAGRSEVEWQDRERLQGAFDGSAITFGSIECRPECKFG